MAKKFTDLPPTDPEETPMFQTNQPGTTPAESNPAPEPPAAIPSKPARAVGERRQNPDLQAIAKIDRILAELTVTAACRALNWLVDNYREKATDSQIDTLPRSL